MGQRYGSPRTTAESHPRESSCSANTVAEIMKMHGVRAKAPKGFVRSTDSEHELAAAENLPDRDFAPAGPNASWCADITSVGTREGWLDLAVVEDLFGRVRLPRVPTASHLSVSAGSRISVTRSR